MSPRVCGLFIVIGLLASILATACVGSAGGPASLTLQWSTDDNASSTVAPSESLPSVLIVRNDGGEDLDAVSLRFDQTRAGQLPYGISIGTITHLSSRFEGDAQVWDLGRIDAGDAITFPMTLWFEASTVTAEPLSVRLVVVGASPELPHEVESNVFEVAVDTRQALGR